MIAAIIFIFGLMIGSFLNVVICRVPQRESIVFPSSHCPNCNTDLKALDLIPVISFIFAKGRCRYCKEKISYQYPLVELVTGIFFLLFYWKYSLSIEFVTYLFLVALLLASSLIDLKHYIIPNKITYLGIVSGLILSIFVNHISFYSSLIGMIIPALFLLLIAIVSRGGMGIGDVKLVAMIGTFIGYQYTLGGIFLGSFLGAIIGTVLIGLKVKGRKDRIPFGPFISIGVLVMMLYGEVILKAYLNLFIY